MPNTLHIQYQIGDIIDNILENWGNENYKVTIESFRRKKDCLVLFRVGNWCEKNYFFKSAVSVRDKEGKSFRQFERIVSFLKKFSHERTHK